MRRRSAAPSSSGNSSTQPRALAPKRPASGVPPPEPPVEPPPPEPPSSLTPGALANTWMSVTRAASPGLTGVMIEPPRATLSAVNRKVSVLMQSVLLSGSLSELALEMRTAAALRVEHAELQMAGSDRIEAEAAHDQIRLAADADARRGTRLGRW